MADMQSFTLWFLNNLPTFLMSDPIKYLWGIALLGYLIKILISFRRY